MTPSTHRPLHVVQISRDAELLRAPCGSECVQRQLEYARELARRTPGGFVTIIVVAPNGDGTGWRHENLAVVAARGPLRGAFDCLRIITALHGTSPIAVITTQVVYDEAWIALAAGRWHGIPVIGQIHGDLFAEHDSLFADHRMTGARRRIIHALRRWTTRTTLAGFSAIRTVSLESRTSLARLAASVPTTTIPVPVPMVCPRTGAVRAGQERPLVIYVGRLAPEKDLMTWLAVARAVSHQHPEVRFELIGDGPERPRLEREAARLGLEDVLSFAGFVPYDRLREKYAAASVLLLTSKTEGFGRVLVEAASQGTPAVSTSLAGPRDIVINGVTGYLREPGDVDGLARSVATLLEHPDRAAVMGERARALVTVKFDPARLRAEWVDLWINAAITRGQAA